MLKPLLRQQCKRFVPFNLTAPKSYSSFTPHLPIWNSFRTMSTDATDATKPEVAALQTKITPSFVSRKVGTTKIARDARDGDGATVRRAIQSNFDPFLMMDNFFVSGPGGFPSHPHRGFETVTYVLDDSPGSFMHEDFLGNAGRLDPGSIQWMTAGRGIVHAEMPVDGKSCDGIQLWVNLKKDQKMCEPAYQELGKESLPTASYEGVWVRVIAGTSLGADAKILTRTPSQFLHFRLKPFAVLEQEIPVGWNSFIYTLRGSGWVGPDANERSPDSLYQKHTTLFMKGADNGETNGVRVVAGMDGFEFVLISGQPIGEPVVQYGPFVMNTASEINEAIQDYRMGRNGFEKAPGFEASIDNRYR